MRWRVVSGGGVLTSTMTHVIFQAEKTNDLRVPVRHTILRGRGGGVGVPQDASKGSYDDIHCIYDDTQLFAVPYAPRINSHVLYGYYIESRQGIMWLF